MHIEGHISGVWATRPFVVRRSPGLKRRRYGSPGRTRTSDTVVNSHLLYQLSYRGARDARISRHANGIEKIGTPLGHGNRRAFPGVVGTTTPRRG